MVKRKGYLDRSVFISILMTPTWQVEKYHIFSIDSLFPWTNQAISYALYSLI